MATPLRGIRAQYLGSAGYVGTSTQSILDFLYVASSTINPLYRVGDRVTTPDGRVFRYSKANGIQYPQGGSYNPLKTIDVAVAPAQATGAGLVGSRTLTITKAATAGVAGDGVIAENELAGGYVVIGNGSGQAPQMRGIVANPASAAGAASLTITLDAAITPLYISGTAYQLVTVGTTTIETYYNPYANLKNGLVTSTDYASFLGVPAVYCTTGQYFWLQTWGACWITSNSVTCDQANDRDIYFVGNGSVVSGYDVTFTADHPLKFQKAGYALDASSSGSSNAPMVMLQISL